MGALNRSAEVGCNCGGGRFKVTCFTVWWKFWDNRTWGWKDDEKGNGKEKGNEKQNEGDKTAAAA